MLEKNLILTKYLEYEHGKGKAQNHQQNGHLGIPIQISFTSSDYNMFFRYSDFCRILQ